MARGLSTVVFVAVAAVVVLVASSGTAAQPAVSPCVKRVRVDENGATGSVFIYITVWRTASSACAAPSRVSLALRDANSRRLLRIRGNPWSRPVAPQDFRHGRAQFTFIWRNYCGPGRPLTVEARVGEHRAVERDSYPGARCDARSQPSTLKRVRVPGS